MIKLFVISVLLMFFVGCDRLVNWSDILGEGEGRGSDSCEPLDPGTPPPPPSPVTTPDGRRAA